MVCIVLNSGINLIDIVYVYGNGCFEELIGEVLKEKEYDCLCIVIVIKVVYVLNKG